jgi:hypothetical protein
MFSVEVISSTDDGELLSERTNIPCASNCEEAGRIVRGWLAARCPIMQRATQAKSFDGEIEISALTFDEETGWLSGPTSFRASADALAIGLLKEAAQNVRTRFARSQPNPILKAI